MAKDTAMKDKDSYTKTAHNGPKDGKKGIPAKKKNKGKK
jgi:hypothetical protein